MCGDSAENIFTKEQRDYVASVKDSDLRDSLLYQVRLRDNLEKDRDKFEKRYYALEKECNELKKKIETSFLCKRCGATLRKEGADIYCVSCGWSSCT